MTVQQVGVDGCMMYVYITIEDCPKIFLLAKNQRLASLQVI